MKTRNIFLVFVLSLFIVSSCGIINKIKNKNSFLLGEGRIEIYFPSEPTQEESSVETDLGTIEMVTYIYEETNSVYMLAYSEYPNEAIEGVDPYELLDGAKDGFIKNIDLKITKENNKSEMDGVPGIYFEAEGGGYYTAVQDYLLENELYQIAILRMDRAPTDKEIKKFIKSFKFIDR